MSSTLYNICYGIYLATKEVLVDIKGSIEKILVFSDIWSVNKSEYLKKFIAISPTAGLFDMNITT